MFYTGEYIYEINNEKSENHYIKVCFAFDVVDNGIGWNEWCGIPGYDSCLGMENIEIDICYLMREFRYDNEEEIPKIKNVSVYGSNWSHEREIEISPELKEKIIDEIFENYDFESKMREY